MQAFIYLLFLLYSYLFILSLQFFFCHMLKVDLDSVQSVAELECLGLDVLKAALLARGMKCGGTLKQRAERLFSVKGVTHIDPSLLSKK